MNKDGEVVNNAGLIPVYRYAKTIDVGASTYYVPTEGCGTKYNEVTLVDCVISSIGIFSK